jgi:hypothetical protein
MPTVSNTRAGIETVLVEAASLLVERARRQAERDGDADSDLERLRDLGERLEAIREELARTAVVPSAGPQPSRYYDVPGQEDG